MTALYIVGGVFDYGAPACAGRGAVETLGKYIMMEKRHEFTYEVKAFRAGNALAIDVGKI